MIFVGRHVNGAPRNSANELLPVTDAGAIEFNGQHTRCSAG